jgi:S1-C subfamily serine protease
MKHFLRPSKKNIVPVFVIPIFALSLGLAAPQALAIQTRSLTSVLPFMLHSASQSYLGVFLGDVDQDRAQALHMPAPQGAEITLLDHDAPAAKGGLRVHDVILSINGEKILTADQLRRKLRSTPIGRKVQLVVSRDGAQLTLSVQIADRRKVQEDAREHIGNGNYSTPSLGFVPGGIDTTAPIGPRISIMDRSMKIGALVEPLSPQMSDFLGVSTGLMIKSVAHKSAASAAGLQPHDVILAVGGEPVITSADWERTLRASEGKPVQVEIMRDRDKQLVLLQVDGKRH